MLLLQKVWGNVPLHRLFEGQVPPVLPGSAVYDVSTTSINLWFSTMVVTKATVYGLLN